MPKINSKEAREARKEAAAIRDDRRDQVTIEQRIAALDARLGSGQGAQKERARLHSS